ncbi:hypothetical protein CXR47_24385 [Vibrio parahaemolyticus]|nr:hypothetical protein CXR47_24385 [Vibrio parahaemolyticus]
MRDKFGVKVGIESDAFQFLHDFELTTGASLSRQVFYFLFTEFFSLALGFHCAFLFSENKKAPLV